MFEPSAHKVIDGEFRSAFENRDDKVSICWHARDGRLGEDLPNCKLEPGHDVSAVQDFGFSECGDVGW